MNQYVTGSVIKRLREKQKLMQNQLADFLGVSDRTVSKWETGRGFPDITFLEPLAKILKVSVAELFSGAEIENGNSSANLSKLNFYVCSVCGEIFVRMNHEMTKTYYISWFACVRLDSVEFAKMYPEQNAEARFRNAGKCKIYAYCIKLGLFEVDF